eukprot:360433-Chlamydomonas_euryale.AAC.11
MPSRQYHLAHSPEQRCHTACTAQRIGHTRTPAVGHAKQTADWQAGIKKSNILPPHRNSAATRLAEYSASAAAAESAGSVSAMSASAVRSKNNWDTFRCACVRACMSGVLLHVGNHAARAALCLRPEKDILAKSVHARLHVCMGKGRCAFGQAWRRMRCRVSGLTKAGFMKPWTRPTDC